MHSLINDKMVETIRTTGNTSDLFPERKTVFEEHSLPYDRQAENAVITGCQILSLLPGVLCSLARLFERKGLSFTFLSREYCCGNNLYRPAVKARDEEAMAECRDFSKEFVGKNIEQAKQFGAKRLIIFCSPCYPIYRHAFPEEDIVFYPAAMDEIMDSVGFEGEIDYYAGCYKLHKRFSPVPMDLKSTNRVFGKLDGLEINRISAPECCYKPAGLSHMVDGIKTGTMVHICTGCYGQALGNIPPDRGVKVMMLPEFVEMALKEN
ncbi:MAG: hypothetical protein GY866_08175 [Proteobacteria bacterium]|nr:hypothetical protein [Pseudomonadota bacterium]